MSIQNGGEMRKGLGREGTLDMFACFTLVYLSGLNFEDRDSLKYLVRAIKLSPGSQFNRFGICARRIKLDVYRSRGRLACVEAFRGDVANLHPNFLVDNAELASQEQATAETPRFSPF